MRRGVALRNEVAVLEEAAASNLFRREGNDLALVEVGEGGGNGTIDAVRVDLEGTQCRVISFSRVTDVCRR